MMKAWFESGQLTVEAETEADRDKLRKFFHDAFYQGLELIGSGEGAGKLDVFIGLEED